MALLTGDEIIEIAMRLEENGEAFYTGVAAKATTLGVKALFQDLAIQEQHHRRAFQRMGGGAVELILSPEQWDEFQAYSDALLQNSLFARPQGALIRAAEAQDERQAVESALGFEKEALLFFHSLRDAVRGPGQQTVDRIIQEEKRHIQRLAGILAGLGR
jgi:rubrerythrin